MEIKIAMTTRSRYPNLPPAMRLQWPSFLASTALFEIGQSCKDGGGATSSMFFVTADCCRLLLYAGTAMRSAAAFSVSGCSVW
ncbi:hypothetical protein TIFTF001_012268 [Ficus carica]|uniref:Uncharacterized protein n=1 Tax=Ficus carica TaxID=3494 RepID=A0AA88AC04_FICCA|nr:hypothetical protein TIFTF001_012268 [Ficus carica]